MSKRLFGCFGFNDIPFTDGHLIDFCYADSPLIALYAFAIRAVQESDLNLIDIYNTDSYFFTLKSASGFSVFRKHTIYCTGEFDCFRVLELTLNEVAENESC